MKNNTQTEPTDKMNNKWEDHSDEPEWGGWKIVSDMLDNPDEVGIYPTSDCYYKLYLFVKSQRLEAQRQEREKVLAEIYTEIRKFRKDNPGYSRLSAAWIFVKNKLSQLEPREE